MSVIHRKRPFVEFTLSREEAHCPLRALGIAREDILDSALPHELIAVGVEATRFTRLRDRLLDVVMKTEMRLGLDDLN